MPQKGAHLFGHGEPLSHSTGVGAPVRFYTDLDTGVSFVNISTTSQPIWRSIPWIEASGVSPARSFTTKFWDSATQAIVSVPLASE